MKPAQVTSVNLCVEMTKRKFIKLWKGLDYDSVVKAMGPSVTKIEYDGHFGPNFFCSCEQAYIPHVEQTLKKLLRKGPSK